MSASENPTRTVADRPDEAAGQMLGRYKLLEKLGEGGFGAVWLAEQKEPVRRKVAFKLIKLGMDTRAVVARFEAERQALAMMDHPNIAKVLDAGATESGRPFFVMELVRGIRITEYCDQNHLAIGDRLDLFIKVCQAIQHAHQKGIIHRDIKPSNILVTLHDGVPVPKVIDFGIAKATQGELTDKTVHTQFQQFIGTPAYMSPEQAEMSGLDIDTRSDIYSLGVLLYELLTGRTPFDPNELMSQGIDAMRKTIREQDPVRPSTRVATLKGEERTATAKRHAADLPRLVHQLKGDLDWIVMKCLEKDRTRRYETATGLSADLRRYLANEPVTARPPSTLYRFQKAARRNKTLFAASGAVAAALVFGMIGTTAGLLRAREQRAAALKAQKLAEQRFDTAREFVDKIIQKVEPEFAELIGASKAREALAHSSLAFLESLGNRTGGDERFQVSLANIYTVVADAIGGVYAPNSLGDQERALSYAMQGREIARQLYEGHPGSTNDLYRLCRAQSQLDSLLAALNRKEEALKEQKRNTSLAEELMRLAPQEAFAAERLQIAHWHLGQTLLAMGRVEEALTQHFLPYAQPLLRLQISPEVNSDTAQTAFIAQTLIGTALRNLGQYSESLMHFEKGRDWKKFMIERNPNNARWARDWSSVHYYLGQVLIKLGRFDEGKNSLAEAVRLAESVAARDRLNGTAQRDFALMLWHLGTACSEQASRTDLPVHTRAALWRESIQALDRCTQQLESPGSNLHAVSGDLELKEVNQRLTDARVALANLVKD